VTEYCDGGDLEKVIEKNGFMEEKDSSRILYGIFKGLLYLN
jgi:serine/threonine protein kinase